VNIDAECKVALALVYSRIDARVAHYQREADMHLLAVQTCMAKRWNWLARNLRQHRRRERVRLSEYED
jgi:hypothetical protein